MASETDSYSPAQIRSAYGMAGVPQYGTGQTIAIVDAYDNPSIYLPLAAFDTRLGLTSAGPTSTTSMDRRRRS